MKKLFIALLFACQFARAEMVNIPAVSPTNWVVENYVTGNVVLWGG